MKLRNQKAVVKTETKTTRGTPIPVRLDKQDDRFLRQASFDTGLPVSDLLRRSVKLMRQQRGMFKGYSFILELA